MAAELKQDELAIAKVSQESVSILDKVKALVVKDQESYNLATDLYKAALAVEKQADDAHDPVISHWHGLHKASVAAKKSDKDLATQAKVLAKSKAAAWQDEQERIRLAEERRLQEIARKQAEEEARIAREAAEAEAKRQREIEEAERLKLAEEAEKAGATQEQVSEILDKPLFEPEPIPEFVPVPVVMPTVAPTFQKASGFTVRYSYSAEVVNLRELIKAAIGNPYFEQFLQPNQTAINAQARNSKDAFNMPGCKIKKERV